MIPTDYYWKNSQELSLSEVRWFYREPKVKQWTQFIGADSIRLETAFRNKSNNFESDNETRVHVRGGFYEVELSKRLCHPVFWSTVEENLQIVTRGTWFLVNDWMPLEEKYADLIEMEHQHFVKKLQVLTAESKNNCTQMSFDRLIHATKLGNEFTVNWTAEKEVFIYSQTTSSKLYRVFGNRLGLGNGGNRLNRGYQYEASKEDKLEDIKHLIFVVHGIGQKLNIKGINVEGNFAKSVDSFRETWQNVLNDRDDLKERVEFIPVQWRTNLKLGSEVLNKITPNTAEPLRNIVNKSVIDIFYYKSPMYNNEIMNALRTELNRLYSMFIERNKNFNKTGKVSIIGHSLGSVLVYDLLTGWNPGKIYAKYFNNNEKKCKSDSFRECKDCKLRDSIQNVLNSEKGSNKEDLAILLARLDRSKLKTSIIEKHILALTNKVEKKQIESLMFKVEYVFCFGSPLGLFLTMRGINQDGKCAPNDLFPKNAFKRLFNIYHPSDLVAYRIEPLIYENFNNCPAVQINKYESSSSSSASSTSNVSRKSGACQSKKSASSISGNSLQKRRKQEPLVDALGLNMFLGSIFKSDGERLKILNTHLIDGDSIEKNVVVDDDDLPTIINNDLAIVDEHDNDNANNINHDERVVAHLNRPIEKRYDFELKESQIKISLLSSFSSLMAHTGYWTNRDVAKFLLVNLFPDLQIYQ